MKWTSMDHMQSYEVSFAWFCVWHRYFEGSLSMFLIPHFSTPLTYFKNVMGLRRDRDIGERRRQQKSIPSWCIYCVFNLLFSPCVLFRPIAETVGWGKNVWKSNHEIRHWTSCIFLWPFLPCRDPSKYYRHRAEQQRMGTLYMPTIRWHCRLDIPCIWPLAL